MVWCCLQYKDMRETEVEVDGYDYSSSLICPEVVQLKFTEECKDRLKKFGVHFWTKIVQDSRGNHGRHEETIAGVEQSVKRLF